MTIFPRMGYWIRWINRKGSNRSSCQMYWTLLEDVELNALERKILMTPDLAVGDYALSDLTPKNG